MRVGVMPVAVKFTGVGGTVVAVRTLLKSVKLPSASWARTS